MSAFHGIGYLAQDYRSANLECGKHNGRQEVANDVDAPSGPGDRPPPVKYNDSGNCDKNNDGAGVLPHVWLPGQIREMQMLQFTGVGRNIHQPGDECVQSQA